MEGELVPPDVPLRDLRAEVNLRSSRAGYTTRDGRPIPPKIQAVVPWGRRRLNVWPRDADGNLIE
jgi:hypothetical protein